MDRTYSRTGAKEISAQTYNLTIGGMLLYGFIINIILCTCFTNVFMMWNPMVLLIGYFVSCIIGIFLSRSNNPILSFIAYNLVVVPMGITLSIALSGEFVGVILNAFIVTATLTATFIVAAIVYPDFFLSLGRTLFFSLLILIVVELIMMFTGFYVPTLIDYIACFIFCGYIGYDWAKAQAMQHTLDNAIDASLALYLDIINLFIRLVEIMGKKKD